MNICNYRLKISYNGIGFEGWQIQPDGHPTIQGCLNEALKKISKDENISSLGSGRTDSGVHALAQIVKVRIPLRIEPKNLKNALNSHLPKTIRVLGAELIDDDFHPVSQALWKRYDYIFTDSEILPPHLLGLVSHFPQEIDQADLESSLKALEGKRDFSNFSTKGTPVASTIRTLHSATLKMEQWPINPYSDDHLKIYRLTFVGDGFLKQMVRLLVGAALKIGSKKSNIGELDHYLKTQTEEKFGPVAPPDGLYLVHVEYDKAYSSVH